MLVCSSCGNEQEVGKFCGKCGSTLEEKEPVAEVEESTSVEEEVTTETTESVGVEKNAAESEGASVETGSQTEQEVEKHVEPAAEQTNRVDPAAQVAQAQQLDATAQTAQAQQAATTQAGHDQTAEIKEHMQSYWNFALRMLKNPTEALNVKEEKFYFGIINFILLSITYGITFIYIKKEADKLYRYGDLFKVSTMNVFFGIFLFTALFSIVAILGTFTIAKLAKTNKDFKSIITQFGALITPVIALQIVTIVLAITESFSLMLAFLLLSILFSYLVLPALLIYEYCKITPNEQGVYFAAAVVLLNILFIYIVIQIAAEIVIPEVYNEFEYRFNIFKGFLS